MPPDRKAKLLEAAKREFATHGYELASTNRILEAAELSKGAFYYYFDDKLDLAATVLMAQVDPAMLAFEVREVDSVEAFWGELGRVSLDRVKRIEADRLGYEATMRLTHAVFADPVMAARVMPMFAPGRIKMVGFLERGVALGALRNDLPIGTLMSLIEAVKTALYKATFLTDRVPDERELEAFADQVMNLARRIVAPEPEVNR
jgi:AcrR family transcriptional regulator